jgi:site-specific DNA-cytosine methylase
VNCVPPGRLRSEQIDTRVMPTEESRRAWAEKEVPAGYIGEPDDLAVLVAFLCSPRARYITGQKWGQSNGTGQLSRKHFYAYRKLHPSIWAWTLNTKADSVYHYKFPRALTVREFARLQSFPDWFVVRTDLRKGMIEGRYDGGAAHSRYRQIGNAVPPLLAEAVARALTEVLNTTKTRPRQSTIAILAA